MEIFKEEPLASSLSSFAEGKRWQYLAKKPQNQNKKIPKKPKKNHEKPTHKQTKKLHKQ